MQYKQIKVETIPNHQNIYLFLKSNGYSENYIKNLRKDSQNIKVNGNFVTTKHKLQQNDILEINSNPNTSTSIMQCDMPLDIVFEDDSILVVNKPSGISSMPNRSHYSHNLAGAIVCYMKQKDSHFVLRMLNRLDKDTQGLIIVAKNALIYKQLASSVSKTYHALVCGKLETEMTIEKNIKDIINENGIINIKRVVAEDGKPAVTYVTPIKVFDEYTLCEIKLQFGRTHQIRVHLSSEGYPLLGDYIYGKESPLINHTALVCKQIEFVHPMTQAKITLKTDYEPDFLKFIKMA